MRWQPGKSSASGAAKTRHERRRIAASRLRAAGAGVSPQEAQDWLRDADEFAVDQLSKVLERAGEETLSPDYRLVARAALAAVAELLDEADTG